MPFHMIRESGSGFGSMRQRTGTPIPRHRENLPAQNVVCPAIGEDCGDTEAFYGWIKTWAWTLAGVFVYITARWVVDACIPADPLASAELFTQVPPLVYQMSSTAFFTALVLNLTSLVFEDNASKRQLALLSCAIKGAACYTDMQLVTGRAHVVYDAFGAMVIPHRYVQWLVTTPTMVYILSKISDFTPMQTATAICMDLVMVLTGLMANFAPGPYLSWLMFSVSMLSFIGVLYMMGLMVYSAVKEHTSHTSRRSLLFIYMCTLLIWSLFPVAWVLHLLNSATPYGEYLNVFANFMAKVLFSSSIMYGNYMTIAQRRLLAQQVAENAHRVRMIQELRDAVTRKDQFMSLMSHELRTPLNGIIQLSDALVRGAGGEMNPKGQHFVKTIKNSSNHLLNIINDILDVAALREGKLTIKHELCSLAKAVDHVVDIVAPLARKDVVIERFVDPRTPLIIADFSRVIQILYNLAGNALKFTHRGRVCVRVAPTSDGTAATLQVADTGIGIPAERINGIWGAFEQVDMSITRKYGGTGLGLSIVKQLVEAHDGQIEVHSAERQGTTFTVTLPVLQPNTRQSLEAQVTESILNSGYNSAQATCRRRSQRLASTSGRNPSLEETISQLARGATRYNSGLVSPKKEAADAAGNLSGSNTLEREDVLYRRRTQELERENLIGELQRRTEHKRSMEEAHFASRQLELSEPERRAERDSRSLECLDMQLGTRTPSNETSVSAADHCNPSATAAKVSGGGGGGSGSMRQCSETDVTVPQRGLVSAGSVGSFHAWRGDTETAYRAAPGRRSLTAADTRDALASRISGGEGYVSTGGNSLADAYEQLLIDRTSTDSHGSNPMLFRKLSATSTGGGVKPKAAREVLRMSTYGRGPGGGGSGGNVHSGPVPATSSHLLMKALDSDLYRIGWDSHDGASTVGADSESEGPRSGRWQQKGSGTVPRASKLLQASASIGGNNPPAVSTTAAAPPGLTLDKLAYSDMYGTVQILSVDDEEVNQIVLEEILTSTGYHFARCMDGLEALEWLCSSENMPDLILLDCMMPNMSGHEFCTALRKVIPGNVLPVIMVSAKSDEDNIVEGLRSGSNDFVRKPYQREELLARIETQLRLKSDSWWLAELVNNVDGRETESTKLLKNILPESIIARMQQGQKFVADSHAHVVILFSDIVGFTSLSSKLPTAEVFLMLSNMFTAFDKLTDRFSVYKVETIGDAYMVAAGHDEDEDKARKGSPLMRVLGFARAMLDVVRNITAPNGERMRVRIGVHCGPAFAGVIGMKCPRYCFLGDTVNTASRMESTGFPMCIHVSEDLYRHHPNPENDLMEVGEHEVKGKGRMRTYLVRVGAWEQALHDFAARQQAAAAAGSVEQQQQQQQQAGDHGVSDFLGGDAASVTSSLPGLSTCGPHSPFRTISAAHGAVSNGGSCSAGQLTMSPSPSTDPDVSNPSRFLHSLLSTVTEETSLPPSPLPTQPARLPSFPEQQQQQPLALSTFSVSSGSAGGFTRLSTGSMTGIRSPRYRPELSGPRELPRSTHGSGGCFFDDSSSSEGAASSCNGMMATCIIPSCSGSLTGAPSVPPSACLGAKLAAETFEKHKLQADLDAERRRAAAASQQVALLQHQVATVAAAASAAAVCSSHQSTAHVAAVTTATTTTSLPASGNATSHPHQSRRSQVGTRHENAVDEKAALVLERGQQPPSQGGRNQGAISEQLRQQQEQQQLGQASGSQTCSYEVPDAEVVILGPVSDDVDFASTGSISPGEAPPAAGVGSPVLEPAAGPLPVPLLLVAQPAKFPRHLPLRPGVITPGGRGGPGSAATEMLGFPFVLTDIEWHSNLRHDHQGDGAETALGRFQRPPPPAAALAGGGAVAVVEADAALSLPRGLEVSPKAPSVNAATAANRRHLYGGRSNKLTVPAAPGSCLLGSEVKAAGDGATAAAAYIGSSTLQPGWQLPRYSLDLLFEDLGLLPYLGRFREEAIRLDQLLGMDVGQLERLGIRPLGYCLRVQEAVLDLARSLLRACEEAALVSQPLMPPVEAVDATAGGSSP